MRSITSIGMGILAIILSYSFIWGLIAISHPERNDLARLKAVVTFQPFIEKVDQENYSRAELLSQADTLLTVKYAWDEVENLIFNITYIKDSKTGIYYAFVRTKSAVSFTEISGESRNHIPAELLFVVK